MGKMGAGGTHKPPYFVARDTVADVRQRREAFAPGSRVTIRSMAGVPNPYEGRLGEVVSSSEVDGLVVYAVRLDVYLREESSDTPVEFLADELRSARR